MPSLKKQYLLDANILIEAARRYYGLDFAKPFWEALCKFAQQQQIISIDKVFDELKTGNDSLKLWAVNDFSLHFKSSKTTNVFKEYAAIVNWAASEIRYSQSAKDIFMLDTNADPFVIAYAKAHNCVVVTHEVFDKNIKRNIPIPNVCEHFNIQYINTFEMLRNLSFSF